MAEGLLSASLPSPLGPLLIAVSKEGVCRVAFGGNKAAFAAELAIRSGGAISEAVEPPEQVARELAEYFDGQRKHFTLPLDYRFVTPFQRLVFDVLLEVPPGQVVSYGDLARAIGRPRSSRAVGSALAHNPLPILIPCHRVICSDGSLSGYSAGVHIKEYLLTLEGVLLPFEWHIPSALPRP